MGFPQPTNSSGILLRDPEKIARQLEYYKNFGCLYVLFCDRVFPVWNADWLEEFCKLYASFVNLPFFVFTHVSLVNEKAFSNLKRCGLDRVAFGIESGSESIRKEVLNRPEDDEAIVRAANILHLLGVKVRYDLIVGNPYESVAEFSKTHNLLKRLPKPCELRLHNLLFFPGTKLTEMALSDGVIDETRVGVDTRGFFFDRSVLSEQENEWVEKYMNCW